MAITIVITPGEPAGVGIEVSLALCRLAADAGVRLVFVADPDLMLARAQRLGYEISCNLVSFNDLKQQYKSDCINIVPVKLVSPVEAGKLNEKNSKYVLNTLDLAINACLNQQASALVTGPIHKGIINQSGIPFTGHTEYLEKRSKAKAVMLLQNNSLKIALATTHVPLKQVSTLIKKTHLVNISQIILTSLKRDFAIPEPRLAVCGLNPHAGEGGHIGCEDINEIVPAIQMLQQQGYQVSGPVPADTIFIPKNRETYDAVLAMYHDQGLPVLKAQGFGMSVNITLGLPFIRTSVDHGTALELAGTDLADTGSMLTALSTAIELATNRLNYTNNE